MVQKTHGKAEQRHIERDMPPRPPGCSDGATREPGGASPHADTHQEKHAERLLVSEKIGDGEMHLPSFPIPKFACTCGTSDANFGIKGTLASFMIQVRVWI